MKEFKFFSKNIPYIFSDSRNPPIANLHAYHERLSDGLDDGQCTDAIRIYNLTHNGINEGELTTYQSIRHYYSLYYNGVPIIPDEDHDRFIRMVEFLAPVREHETNFVWRGDIVELEEMGVLDDDE